MIYILSSNIDVDLNRYHRSVVCLCKDVNCAYLKCWVKLDFKNKYHQMLSIWNNQFFLHDSAIIINIIHK